MTEPLPLAIICDLDGTLAHLNGRSPYDASSALEDGLNVPVAHIVQTYAAAGTAVILVSGREDKYRRPTEAWLAKHDIPYDALYMRRTRDFRKDAIIKTEIYNAKIRDQYAVLFVLDDRNQVVEMWRGLGLTCLQVAPGDF
jgi:hypothetical protein